MTTPLTASEHLEREFVNIRSRLLDAAAMLDRIDRAEGHIASDPRWQQLMQVLELLRTARGDRAERLQQLLSLPYDPDWRKAFGRTD